MSATILIVEDESLIAMEIASTLQQEGYEICATVNNGDSAIEAVRQHSPDLIMMDICIEGSINGVETAERIGRMVNIPIIFLTAYSDDSTLQSAIKTSPEAYLLKPFKRQELMTAIKLALYKSATKPADSSHSKIITLGNHYRWNRKTQQILHEEVSIQLTKQEMKLFELLYDAQGSVVSFSDIEYELWPDKEVNDTTRRTLIYRLRLKLSELDIKTIHGIGCILHLA